MVTMTCKLCEDSACISVFEGSIRTGSFGMMSDRSYEVLECSGCGVQFLNPFPDMAGDFYESDQYRKEYTETIIDVNKYFTQNDDLQIPRLHQIGLNNLRGKVVGDFGCGAGCFLDLAKGVADHTVAVEPFEHYHSSLKRREHQVFKWGHEVPAGILDLVVTFDTIEHAPDPVDFLKQIYNSLKPGGLAYIVTPNRDDILMQICAEQYGSFYYRSARTV
jgi:SAM-dependent methyltransferase